MKVEKTYTIKEGEWTTWSDTLAVAIKDFHSVYTLYPNILEANDYTFSQFDFLVNINPYERECVRLEDSITGAMKLPNQAEIISLKSFDCQNADINFAVDNQLADKQFRLIYDDEPEWDEQVIPEDCPENELDEVFNIYSSTY